MAGEKDPFPYPDALLRGFNQLILTCALHDVPKAQQPMSIPEFVAAWAILPLTKWAVKLDVPADLLVVGDRLLDPEYGGNPTVLCRRLSRGEVMPLVVKKAINVDKVVHPMAITKGK